MSNRTYFPNKTIKDSRLPFLLEITSGLTAYARHSNGELRLCETLELKKKRWLVINHQGFVITLKGFEPEKECKNCGGSGTIYPTTNDSEDSDQEKDCSNCKGKGKFPEHFIYEIKEESRTIHKTQNIGATNGIV